jgi:hypothetical protein
MPNEIQVSEIGMSVVKTFFAGEKRNLGYIPVLNMEYTKNFPGREKLFFRAILVPEMSSGMCLKNLLIHDCDIEEYKELINEDEFYDDIRRYFNEPALFILVQSFRIDESSMEVFR